MIEFVTSSTKSAEVLKHVAMETLEQVWLNHREALLSFIRRRVTAMDLAEDILQDVFLKAHANLNALNNLERIQSWVYQITRRTVIDHYRTNRTNEPLPEHLPHRDPDRSDEWWEIWAKCVRPMIAMLPEPYRDALLLSDIEGLPIKVVAEQLNLSLPCAKSRVQRGRAKLKQIYLDCCQIEFDRRGAPMCWSAKDCSVDC